MSITSSRPRRRVRIGAVLAAGVTVMFTSFAGSASAAAPSAQDLTFATGNAQTSHAEIVLADIALERSSNAQARELATMTKKDHTDALAKLTAVAEKTGITLPGEPNAAQKADAAKLKSVSAAEFDATYAQIQVAGHRLSIAATDTEIAAGQDPDVVAYADGYLPVATMHLQMAEDLMKSVGATPTAVPAGDGGQAAAMTTGSSSALPWVTLAVALVVLGAFVIVRRRTSRA